MLKRFALIGNSNCGKTTLFNRITGAHEYVGNRTSVTVSITSRKIKNTDYILYDLPGIYSLSSVSEDERIANDFLKKESLNGIINIVDGNNLERNLYLTIQLILLNVPMVIAVNMADEMKKSNIYMDIIKFSSLLGIKCFMISAKSGQGINELISNLNFIARPKLTIKEKYSRYFDKFESEFEDVKKANTIYKIAEEVVNFSVTKPEKQKKLNEAIDKIILHKYLAIPLLIGIMAVIFLITFGSLGSLLQKAASYIYELLLVTPLKLVIESINPGSLIHSLVIDAAAGSVGLVISFVPQIILLFVFISILEDTGYMARAAFILDRLFSKIGLSGKAFIPLILGFGCTTPAVMSAKSIASSREKSLAVILTPYMSCSAKLPIYLFFADIFFPDQKGSVIFFMYLLGIFIAVILGRFLSKRAFLRDNVPYITELPKYRLPTLKTTLRLVDKKVKDFLLRAGTTIFLMSVIIWLLQHFDLNLNLTYEESGSILSFAGMLISPLFNPLGFGSWQASVALLSGLVAKETVISSLCVLFSDGNIASNIVSIFTRASALSYMTFCLLYTPCISAISAMARELKSRKWLFIALFIHIFIAYIVSFIIYSIANAVI